MKKSKPEYLVIDHGEEYTNPNDRFELYETNPQRAKLVEIWEKRDSLANKNCRMPYSPMADGLVWEDDKK